MERYRSVSDLRLSDWYRLSGRSADIRKAVACKCPTIKRIATNYAQQINNAIGISSVIGWAFAEGTWHGRSEIAARYKVWGHVEQIPIDDPGFQKKLRRYKALVTKQRRGHLFMPGVQEGVSFHPERQDRIAWGQADRILSMMYAQLVLIWGTFEALAGDLWEEAVNLCPDRLAKPEDIISLDKMRRAAPEKNPYDLTGKVGSALALDKEFIRLANVRKIYAATFKKHPGKINLILGRKSLDALSLVRNVIVHNGAKMDSEYKKAYPALRRILPKPEIGKQLPVNGRLVSRLTAAVRDCGTELFEAIDLWLTRHLK